VKVLLDHPNPFLLAHGGHQIQIEQTKAALEKANVDVEYIRFWDDQQRGDVIHYFGRPFPSYIEQAHTKRIKVVLADLLGQWGSRTAFEKMTQRAFMSVARSFLPGSFLYRLGWDSFEHADASIALTPFEGHIMQTVFNAPAERVFVVPNGVEEVFKRDSAVKRGEWMVCTATIRDVKRVLEVGQAAVEAETPIWFIGKPYEEGDAYAQRFLELARANRGIIRYEGAISDRDLLAKAYQEARGFVLLSAYESLSIAALEAAACGCPLLLSDLPWARSVFGEQASYCAASGSTSVTAAALRKFYDRAQAGTFKPKYWSDVASDLKQIYEQVLQSGRK
jgi:glycosyltransferase involved in cell wall biosynthesis